MLFLAQQKSHVVHSIVLYWRMMWWFTIYMINVCKTLEYFLTWKNKTFSRCRAEHNQAMHIKKRIKTCSHVLTATLLMHWGGMEQMWADLFSIIDLFRNHRIMHIEGKMIASCTTSLSLIYTYSVMKWSFHRRIPLECGKAHGVKIFLYSDGGAFYHTKVGQNLLDCILREVWS